MAGLHHSPLAVFELVDLKLKYGEAGVVSWTSVNLYRRSFQILFMVEVGETAPFFSEKKAGGDADEFVLERKLDFGPVVLAFFPAAFSSPCEEEMQNLKNLSKSLSRSQGHVVGVSADSPFCLEAFKSQHDVEFDLVSDMSRRVSSSYGVDVDIPELGLYGVPNRSVFILDTEGKVIFKWEADDPAEQPDIDRIKGEIRSLDR